MASIVEKLLILRQERRNELFEGPPPSAEAVLQVWARDQQLTEVINLLERAERGDEDDEQVHHQVAGRKHG